MRKEEIENPRYPHRVTITRLKVSDNPFAEGEDETVVLYSGPGRSYTDTTVTGDGKVDTNRRKAVIPIRFDMWAEPILDGDMIKSEIGSITEEGVVTDFESDNQRTMIYWEYGRV